MFAEPKMSPSLNSNTKTANKKLSTNEYNKQERQKAVDYRGTVYKVGNVLQQKPRMPKTEGNYNGLAVNNSRDLTNAMGYLQLKEKVSSKEENQKDKIIQKKIGFEFQTNCHISRNVKQVVRGIDPLPQETETQSCLPKNKKLVNGLYVNVVADDNCAEYSDVEFATKPLDNYADLKKANEEMKLSWYMLRKLNIEGKLEDCYLSKNHNDLYGRPQVTFGTSLVNMKLLAETANNKRVEANRKRYKNLDKIKDPKNSNLNGLIELIKSYMRKGEKKKAVEYPKKITDTFLLSRTDFGSLLKLCEDKIMPGNTAAWLNLFRDFDLNKPLFPKIKKESGHKYDINITRKQWLLSIYNNNDVIRGIRDQESMSSMGLDTITHYPDNRRESVGIFELRANQGIEHYLFHNPSWFQFMDSWYKVIENTGYLPPSDEAAKKDWCLTF